MRTPTFIDLFAGAGGLSLGLKRAGWKSLLAVDIWQDALATYQVNFDPNRLRQLGLGQLAKRGRTTLRADLSDPLDKAKLLATARDLHADWIVGGPPCKGFSTIGKRLRDDPRNKLVEEFSDIVESLAPKGFLIENVLGLRDMDFVGQVVQRFTSLGYTVTPAILKAADYGVPQLRRRIIFVGTRSGQWFLKPCPSHRATSYVTVWDAIGDLPELAPGDLVTDYDKDPRTEYQRCMRLGSANLQGHQASRHPQHLVQAISHIPDGGSRRSIPEEYQPSSGYHNSYSRLHSQSPAVAVTQNMGKPSATRCIHPFQHRGLTAREGARLQSFPDWFHFTSGITAQREQIANAVPPILAECLGRALLDPRSWVAEAKLAVLHNGMDREGRLVGGSQLPMFAQDRDDEGWMISATA